MDKGPIPLKRIGEPFEVTQYEPEHPAKDCEARFQASIEKYGEPHIPRGQIWQWGCHMWSCYMRNAPHGFEHYHGHFVEAAGVRRMVELGQADDPFLLRNYKLVCEESP